MKLNESRPTIETSGELEEQFFSIQDQGMIFDILRNKMYSNPILAICREISCNARDAHREIGKPEIPITICLPNALEPFYKIKDFGPGISPDRMSNIFIKYTASTKREDNIQTGGFGLGAKTPFSYSDTFTIVTNFEGMQYNYACFIDETKVGKLILLSSTETTEPNGTEIIIPVKHPDFRLFTKWTEQSTKHWDVKPTIKGGTITYSKIEKIIDGNNWAVVRAEGWNREVKLIIDGIEYPLELSALKTYADSKMIDSVRGNIYLYFNVGDLSLSASREQVYLDQFTQEKIKLHLEKMTEDVKERVVNKIETFPDFWTANIYYRSELTDAFSNLSFLGQLSWHGTPLFTTSNISLNCPVFIFSKGKFSRKYGTDPNKISRSNGNGTLCFENNTELFINDLSLKAPTGRHVKKAFDDNPDLNSIRVVCPNDAVTLDVLNKKFHFDLMNARNLSEITKATGRKGTYTTPTSRLIVFKLHDNDFRQISRSSIDEDLNEKVLCKLRKDSYGNNREAVLNNKRVLSSAGFRTLRHMFPSISFYGVDLDTPNERLDDEFSDFIDLEEFINSKILSNSTINFIEIKYAKSLTYKIDSQQLNYLDKFRNLIVNPDSLFLKRLNLHNKLKKMAETDYGLLDIYESINGLILDEEVNLLVKNNKDLNLHSFNSKYEKKYPLILNLSLYKYDELLPHLAQYINFIDSI